MTKNMKRRLLLAGVLISCVACGRVGVATLGDKIECEAMIVTKAELRRHLAAAETDHFRPASYAELRASRGAAQPDYLVVRFRERIPGHYYGEAEARLDGSVNGIRFNVLLHFNKGWVEYFIPLDGRMYGMPQQSGSPSVTVTWNSLQAK